MMQIAFLGLGAMGSRMAASVARAGHPLAVWNRSPAATAPLAALGAQVAGTPREAVREADLVVSMVTDDVAARSVWLDPTSGAVHGLRPGAIAVEASTVSYDWIMTLGDVLDAAGAGFLDAPVAGSRPQAETGQLIFMVGGDESVLARAEPALRTMGQTVLHVGGRGQGARLKLAINALFAAQLTAMAELLVLLERSGFEGPAAADLLGHFPVVSPALAGAVRMMAARSTAPLFTIDLLAKDVAYAVAAGEAAGIDLQAVSATHAILARAQAEGLGNDNITALTRLHR